MTDPQITSQKLQGDVVAISIKGYLDAYTCGKLEQVINTSFNQNLYKLIVDLSQVEYMSSAAAGVLIDAMGVAMQNQGNIILVRPQPDVKRVFDLLYLSQIFIITDNRESALKTFNRTFSTKPKQFGGHNS